MERKNWYTLTFLESSKFPKPTHQKLSFLSTFLTLFRPLPLFFLKTSDVFQEHSVPKTNYWRDFHQDLHAAFLYQIDKMLLITNVNYRCTGSSSSKLFSFFFSLKTPIFGIIILWNITFDENHIIRKTCLTCGQFSVNVVSR